MQSFVRPSPLLPRLCTSCVRLPTTHHARSYAVQAPGQPAASVFNTEQKTIQRSRAALNAPLSRQVDYLRDEIATRLVTRLLDINRNYDRVLDYGANACNIARILTQPDPDPDSAKPVTAPLASKISTLVSAEHSHELLYRDSDPALHPFNTPSSASGMRLERHHLSHPETLPFAPSSFDLILSSLSLHWINDLPSVLTQINHLLKPDCAFLGAMPGGDTLYELRGSLQLATQERLGGIKSHVSPLADVRDVGNLLSRAGFKLLTVDVDDIVVSYPDLVALLRDLNAMGEGNASLRMEKGPVGRDVLMAAEGVYRELYGDEDGGLPATFRTIYMIGWKEGEGQSSPLPRGSGEVDLKGFLEGGGRG
ncbi:S-adenosyl-L-methionine-dependent methyltransferase [Elsinoe ampelina]|uniref:S-adenosyl-L-methionine-dependent methyltransferase n=1 Tax=Elsinoe ampelina TaxID=302913 RepID=A0A6A6GK86_9PEZI|nr:S-adenosyl-L-methionine-dependent methyltransferase [Elsinoe ampelina]